MAGALLPTLVTPEACADDDAHHDLDMARRDQWLAAIVAGGALNLVASAAAYFLYYSIITCFR